MVANGSLGLLHKPKYITRIDGSWSFAFSITNKPSWLVGLGFWFLAGGLAGLAGGLASMVVGLLYFGPLQFGVLHHVSLLRPLALVRRTAVVGSCTWINSSLWPFQVTWIKRRLCGSCTWSCPPKRRLLLVLCGSCTWIGFTFGSGLVRLFQVSNTLKVQTHHLWKSFRSLSGLVSFRQSASSGRIPSKCDRVRLQSAWSGSWLGSFRG